MIAYILVDLSKSGSQYGGLAVCQVVDHLGRGKLGLAEDCLSRNHITDMWTLSIRLLPA